MVTKKAVKPPFDWMSFTYVVVLAASAVVLSVGWWAKPVQIEVCKLNTPVHQASECN